MMAPFEVLAALYFVACGVVAWAVDRSGRRRAAALVLSLGASLAIVALARHTPAEVRAWVPHLYLVGGYWLPALLVPRVTTETPFERWLAASDRRIRPRLPAVPASLSHLTEIAYLLCYPLVPAALVVVLMLGSTAELNRFWVAVLAAGYASYGTLPWLVSRPPRLAGGAVSPARSAAAVNTFVLGRVSHQLNTFPSGHVAVSSAAACTVWSVSPVAGLVVGAMAVAIAIGAVAGRYHYVVDVGLGIAVAAVAVAVSWMV